MLKSLFKLSLTLLHFYSIFSALSLDNSPEFRVNSHYIDNQMFPSIANLGNTKFVICFLSNNFLISGQALAARIFDSNGTSLSQDILLSFKAAPTSNSYSLVSNVVGLQYGDSFVVTWIQGGNTLFAKVFNSNGMNLTDDILIDNSAANSLPSICSVENENNFIITWQSASTIIYMIKFCSNGTILIPKSQITVADTAFVNSLDPSGSYMIIWNALSQSNDYDIYARRYFSNGTNMASDIQLINQASGHQRFPSFCLLEDSFVAVWVDENVQDGSGSGVFARIFNLDGTASGSSFQVNDYSLSVQSGARICSLDNGKKFVVTWHSFGQDSSSFGVFAKVFDSSGVALGPEFILNTYTNGDQSNPSLTNFPNRNSFAITWHSQDQDGSEFGVYTKIFSLQQCSSPMDFYYSLNKTCSPYCSSTSFVKNSIAGVLHCDPKCKGSYLMTSNSSCVPSCNIPGYKARYFNDYLLCELICNSSQFYHSYNKTCLNSCPQDLNMFIQKTGNGALLCEFVCNDANSFLYIFNQSCLPACSSIGFQPSNVDDKIICNFNCFRDYFFFPSNVSCSQFCSFLKRNESGYMFCDFYCSSTTYYYSYNSSCLPTCQSLGFLGVNNFGNLFCSFKCSKNEFLNTANSTCQTSCIDSPAITSRNESAYLFCDFKCLDPIAFLNPATNSCVPECPIKFFKNYIYKICSSCPENCLDCRDSTYCLVCKSLYEPKNGICVIISTTHATENSNSNVTITKLNEKNVVGSLVLPSIQLLALSTNEKVVYITSDSGSGLIAIDVQDSASPKVISSFHITNGQSMQIIDNLIYIADSTSGLRIIDANDPKSLSTLSVTSTANAKQVAVDASRNVAVVADLDGKLNLFDVKIPASPSLLSSMSITSQNTTVYKSTLSNDGQTLFVSSSTGFYIVDISDSSKPVILNSTSNIFPKSHASNALDSNFIYYTEASGGIKVLDVSNKASPQIIQSLATAQIQSLSCYSLNCYASSGSSLIVFDSSQKSSLHNRGAVPTFSLANAFEIKNNMKIGYLVDGATALRVIDFQSSPAYVLFVEHNVMEIGRKYVDKLLIYSQMMNGSYEIYSKSYKFSKLSFYAVSYNPDSSLLKTFTNLPYWLDFDTSTNFLSSNPDAPALIGEYNLYGAFSTSIPQNAFIGIGPIANLDQSIELIILHLSRYIDENMYLTSIFDPNKELLLIKSHMIYEIDIRKKLSEFYSPMIVVIKVVSSLKLNQNFDTREYLSISTASLYSTSISITFNSTKVQFMNIVTQSITKINNIGNSISLTAAASDLNESLMNLRIDIVDLDNALSDGKIIINDALNPTLIINTTNLTKFFLKNQAPFINFPIQMQINSLSIVTGSQFSIFLDPNTFIDPDKDSLTYTIISSSDKSIPSWIDFKNMVISGIPPDQLYFELNLMIRASDGYKSVNEKFVLKIEPSLFYLFQLAASFAGPILGVLGLWVYASRIYNIFCKKMYRYPKNFVIENNSELKEYQVYPIALVGSYLKEVKILIFMMKSEIKKELHRKKISRIEMIEYFLDISNTNYVDEAKISNTINRAVLSNSSHKKNKLLRHYFLDLEFSRKKIISLIIKKFHIWYLDHQQHKETKKIFEKLKKNWAKIVDLDKTEPIGADGLPNFFLTINLDEFSSINKILLENALLSFVQFTHNLDSEMPGVSVSAKEKSHNSDFLRRVNDFFNSGSFTPSLDTSGPLSDGIAYKIEGDLIYFGGFVSQYYKSKTIIVNVYNSSGKILRQFEIKEIHSIDAQGKRKSLFISATSSKLYEKKISIMTRESNKTFPEKHLLIENTGNQLNDTSNIYKEADLDQTNPKFASMNTEEQTFENNFEGVGLKLELPTRTRFSPKKDLALKR